jgi:hypothetical protein
MTNITMKTDQPKAENGQPLKEAPVAVTNEQILALLEKQ